MPEGRPKHLSLRNLLQPTVDTQPGRPALHGRQVWTYLHFDEAATHLARSWLDRGLEPGDRVAMLLPNLPEALVVYFACFKSGLVAVPLDYRYRPPQINYVLRHSGSRIFVTDVGRLDEVAECEEARHIDLAAVGGDGAKHNAQPLLDRSEPRAIDLAAAEFRPDDVAILFYTSGTTSRPKGVTMTRAALTAGTMKFLAGVPLSTADVALVSAPLMRPFALRTQVLPTLHAGGGVVLLEKFTPADYLAALRRPPVKTFLAMAPSTLHQLVHDPSARPEDFAGVRLCISGGDRVPLDLHRAFQQRTGLELSVQCGMTETGMYALTPPFGRKKPGSIGLPFYGTQVCLVDAQGNDVRAGEVGEVVVRGPLVMDGYWNDSAQTRKTLRDGACRTGDLARFDEDGCLWFVGRQKNIIVHDGANVCPAEVEDALLEHPAVAEACVVGATDAVHGQNVHAFVTLRPETPAPTSADLRLFAEARMSRQMVPEQIHVVAELPRTGAGKIDRDRLHWQAEAGTTTV
ncbi:MAG: acyl--CoA ligase [Gemmataceae bacterium]|nr:acyl--CoA ligase [Gemmataceae bacterium]